MVDDEIYIKFFTKARREFVKLYIDKLIEFYCDCYVRDGGVHIYSSLKKMSHTEELWFSCNCPSEINRQTGCLMSDGSHYAIKEEDETEIQYNSYALETDAIIRHLILHHAKELEINPDDWSMFFED